MKKIIHGSIIFLFFVHYLHAGVVICSIPKCGTHLLMALLSEIGYTIKGCMVSPTFLHLHADRLRTELGSREYTITHAIASKENIEILQRTGHKVIFIYRDPRDQLISFARYLRQFIKKNRLTAAHWPYNDMITKLMVTYSIDTRVYCDRFWSDPLFTTMGSIADFYRRYMHWQDCPYVYTTRFEALVGAKGGGSDALQEQEVSNICAYLGVERTPDQIKEIANRLFGHKQSASFVKGAIGQWCDTFTPIHTFLFKVLANDLLVELDYENDYSW